MTQYLKIYSNCIPCRGTGRSAIYDLQRGKLYTIPNTLHDILTEDGCIAITSVDKGNREVLTEYIDFLLSNELAFQCSKEQATLFPPLSTNWLFPSVISNCILDITDKARYFNDNFLLQLDRLNCYHLHLRFFKKADWNMLTGAFKLINESSLKSVEVLIPDDGQNDFLDRVEHLVAKHRKIKQVIVHSAAADKLIKHVDEFTGSIIQSGSIIDSNLHCGIIDREQFAVNILHYTESLHHNTCLNRKIAIDTGGNIKNCPGMKENFGNIKDTTLEEAINKPGFKKYWNIKKDEIAKCKDCEFRHVCTDCRAYLDNPDDIYSAPLKCGYDPYTCTWEEWSTNPLKQKAMDYYGMGGSNNASG